MRVLTALLLVSLSLCVAASELQTFALKHRPATEIIPILQPMLGEDTAITGTGYLLIVRSNKEGLAEIARLLEQLDRAPQQLLITVEQDGAGQTARSGIGVSGNSREPRVETRLYNSRRDGAESIGQQLRVMEGQWATIRAGSAVPQVVQRYPPSGAGTQLEQHIEYRDVESGFEVRPRIHGEQVIVDIRPFRARQTAGGGGVIEQQSLSTTVSGPLGQWLEIGGAVQSASHNEHGILYSTTGRDRENHTVRLKVERIND